MSSSNQQAKEQNQTTATKLLTKSDLEPKQFPLYSMTQVSDHCDVNACWIVLWDKVYDVTEFVKDVSFIQTIVKFFRIEFCRIIESIEFVENYCYFFWKWKLLKIVFYKFLYSLP